MKQRIFAGVVALAAVLWAGTSHAGATDKQKCEAAKLSAAGKYAACRLGAEKKAVLKAIAPDYTKCDDKYTTAWGKAESKYTSACPTSRDQSAVQRRVTGDAGAVNAELGGTMPTVLRRLPATGQTTPSSPSTAGGDDGTIQAGAALNYVDNGDGAITDVTTDLVWEKKIKLDGTPDAADPHDADNCYSWSGSCHTGGATCSLDVDCGANGPCDAADCQAAFPSGLTIFKWVALLNTANFAGHNDWRIPNVKELHSIEDYEEDDPSVSAAFNGASCGGACTDMTNPSCSCTQTFPGYWSSTTVHGTPTSAWAVSFSDGVVTFDSGTVKSSSFGSVRAVRGGL